MRLCAFFQSDGVDKVGGVCGQKLCVRRLTDVLTLSSKVKLSLQVAARGVT